MSIRLLIAGGSSPLGGFLVREALSRGIRVAATFDPGNPVEEREEAVPDDLLVVPWNRISPVSARSVLLKAVNRFGGLDGVILLSEPERAGASLHEIASVEVERRVDADIKGSIFMLKEAAAYFLKQGGGSLAFVISDEGAEVLSPLDAAVRGSVRGLASSFFSLYQNEPLLMIGFESATTATEEYSRFIFRNYAEVTKKGSGRWFRFGGRSGLLGSLSRSR